LLSTLDPALFPPALRAAHQLAGRRIAIRQLRTSVARDALDRAACAAREAGIQALEAEVRTPALP